MKTPKRVHIRFVMVMKTPKRVHIRFIMVKKVPKSNISSESHVWPQSTPR